MIRRSWVRPVLLLAMCASVLVACGGDESPSAPTQAVETGGDAACVAAEASASEFMREHTEGPLRLSAEERADMQRRMAEVEGKCPLPEATRFGRDVLEPWSAIGSDPACTGTPGEATARACDPP